VVAVRHVSSADRHGARQLDRGGHVPLAATGVADVSAPNGVQAPGPSDGYATFRVGSGTWSFTTS
jgi:hypothetical protein